MRLLAFLLFSDKRNQKRFLWLYFSADLFAGLQTKQKTRSLQELKHVFVSNACRT